MGVVIGIDLGTEGVKIVAVDETGCIIEHTYETYGYDTPRPGWVEQTPNEWWRRVIVCLQRLWNKGVDASQVEAVGITGQMHSPVILGHNMEPVRKSILWNDTRSTQICHDIDVSLSQSNEQFLYNSILPGYTISSLLWIMKNEPQLINRINTVILPKDYLKLKLTGVVNSDNTDASGTGVFDFEQRTWNWNLIAFLGIPARWFPELSESHAIIGNVHREAAAATGLPLGVPVISGAGDNPVSGVGTALELGKGFITLGTSGAVGTYHKELPKVKRGMHSTTELPLHVNSAPLTDHWLIASSSLSAGASLRWFRDSFSAQSDYDQLMHEADHIPVGSDGLIFVPHLTGTRSTHHSTTRRGAFIGLQLGHKGPHLIRSIIEGVSFSLKDSLLTLEAELQRPFHELSFTGGASKSTVWSQLLADVLNCTIYTASNFQGAAFGVAILAGIGIGLWTPEFRLPQPDKRVFYPSQQVDEYQSAYDSYREVLSW